jgi:hypothetical protein
MRFGFREGTPTRTGSAVAGHLNDVKAVGPKSSATFGRFKRGAAVCGSNFGRFVHAPLANGMSMQLGPSGR